MAGHTPPCLPCELVDADDRQDPPNPSRDGGAAIIEGRELGETMVATTGGWSGASAAVSDEHVSITGFLREIESKREHTNVDDVLACLEHVLTGRVTQIQVAAFLAALRFAHLDRDARVVAGAVRLMKKHALKPDLEGRDGLVDIVGTGGDGQNTFNVSTAAGILCAAAGLRVCKHGNRAATSTAGSADLLVSLGAPVTNLKPSSISSVLKAASFVFLFAPIYHPALGPIAPVRKQLGFPTLFNLLGPLLNPAPIQARIIGVPTRELGSIFAQTLRELHISKALVVCGQEGLDEISIAGPTHTWSVDRDAIVEETLHPSDFGVESHALKTVISGTAEANAETMRKLAAGKLSRGHPIRDFVVINAAALLRISGMASSWQHGRAMIESVIDEARGSTVIDLFVRQCQHEEGLYVQ